MSRVSVLRVLIDDAISVIKMLWQKTQDYYNED